MFNSVNISKVFFVSSSNSICMGFHDSDISDCWSQNKFVLPKPDLVLPHPKLPSGNPVPLPQWQPLLSPPTVLPPTKKSVRTLKEDRPTCECGNDCPYGDCGW